MSLGSEQPALPSEAELRGALCRLGQRLHDAGLVAGTAGNISARMRDGRVIVTPRGVRKDALKPDDLVRLAPYESNVTALDRATTEWPLHRACLAADPQIHAVVHTHAPALTAIGLRRVDIADLLPEAADAVGGIARVPWAPSGSDALGDTAADAVRRGAAVVILEGHGAVSVGGTLEEAFDRTELAELSARAVLMSG